jgi:hypothetical protein
LVARRELFWFLDGFLRFVRSLAGGVFDVVGGSFAGLFGVFGGLFGCAFQISSRSPASSAALAASSAAASTFSAASLAASSAFFVESAQPIASGQKANSATSNSRFFMVDPWVSVEWFGNRIEARTRRLRAAIERNLSPDNTCPPYYFLFFSAPICRTFSRAASPSASLAGSGAFEPPPQPKANAQITQQNDNKTNFLNIIALPDNSSRTEFTTSTK